MNQTISKPRWFSFPAFWTLVVFFIALSVRLVVLWQVSGDPRFHEVGGDGAAFLDWAKQIQQEGWIGKSVFFQSPLYPYICALFQTIFGTDLIRLLIFQAVIGSAGCAILCIATARLLGAKTGAVAGLMLALFPAAVSYDLQVDKTVLDPPLIAAILLAVVEAIRRPGKWPWFACGLALGVISLTRENAAALFLPIVAWLWWYFTERPRRQRVGWIAMIIAGVTLVVLPVCIRNMAIGGQFYISTSKFGLNFYLGNAAHVDGVYQPLRPGRGNVYFEFIDSTDIAQKALGRTLTPGEVSDYWMKRTLADIRSDPGRFVALNVKKFVMFWCNAEIADADVHDRHVVYSPLLAAMDRWYGFGLILASAAVGLVLKRARWRELILLATMALVYGLAVSAFINFGRYRLPVVPILLPLSAAAVTSIRQLNRGNAFPVVLAAASTIALVLLGDHLIPLRIRGANEYNRAMAYEGKSDFATAESLYREALAINPNLVDAGTNLGNLLLRQGKVRSAIELLRPAAQRHADAGLWSNLGMACAQEGDLPGAVDAFKKSFELEPMNATYRFNLAQGMAMTGNGRKAIELLRGLPADAPDEIKERATRLMNQLSAPARQPGQ